jgi:hypothetical protein
MQRLDISIMFAAESSNSRENVADFHRTATTTSISETKNDSVQDSAHNKEARHDCEYASREKV